MLFRASCALRLGVPRPLSVARLFVLPLAGAAQGVKTRHPLPDEHGRAVTDNLSTKGSVAPAVFEHRTHHLRYMCRVCHLGPERAFQRNATPIAEPGNRNGFLCGACHLNVAFPLDDCRRCHPKMRPY